MPTTRQQNKSQPTGHKGKRVQNKPNNKKLSASQPTRLPGVGRVGPSAQCLPDNDDWLTSMTDHLPSLGHFKSRDWLAGTWDSPSASVGETTGKRQSSPGHFRFFVTIGTQSSPDTSSYTHWPTTKLKDWQRNHCTASKTWWSRHTESFHSFPIIFSSIYNSDSCSREWNHCSRPWQIS